MKGGDIVLPVPSRVATVCHHGADRVAVRAGVSPGVETSADRLVAGTSGAGNADPSQVSRIENTLLATTAEAASITIATQLTIPPRLDAGWAAPASGAVVFIRTP
ncbi:MAG: hypothetical protein ACRDRT_02275 [Pseudonocardiaceae bacterium]